MTSKGTLLSLLFLVISIGFAAINIKKDNISKAGNGVIMLLNQETMDIVNFEVDSQVDSGGKLRYYTLKSDIDRVAPWLKIMWEDAGLDYNELFTKGKINFKVLYDESKPYKQGVLHYYSEENFRSMTPAQKQDFVSALKKVNPIVYQELTTDMLGSKVVLGGKRRDFTITGLLRLATDGRFGGHHFLAPYIKKVLEDTVMVVRPEQTSQPQPQEIVEPKQEPVLQVEPEKKTIPRVKVTTPKNFPRANYVEQTAGLNIQMVYVKGGDFMMGATPEQEDEAEKDEKDLRMTQVDSYFIGAFEITQRQWELVMGTSVNQQKNNYVSSLALYGVGANFPMYYITWEEANDFCEKLSILTGKNYQLPTEAQWEYAARGGEKKSDTKYSGSSSIHEVAWFISNSGSSSHPVGSKAPNTLGLYDMSGNIYEWCLDKYGPYQVTDSKNPQGFHSSNEYVLRGGSWGANTTDCRVSDRYYYSATTCGSNIGFRIVMIP